MLLSSRIGRGGACKGEWAAEHRAEPSGNGQGELEWKPRAGVQKLLLEKGLHGQSIHIENVWMDKR